MRKDRATLTGYCWMVKDICDKQRHNKPSTIKSNVIAVQHACSSMIIKGNRTNLESQPQRVMHHDPPLPPLLPDVPLIHQSNHRPHHHNGYHFMFLNNIESCYKVYDHNFWPSLYMQHRAPNTCYKHCVNSAHSVLSSKYDKGG